MTPCKKAHNQLQAPRFTFALQQAKRQNRIRHNSLLYQLLTNPYMATIQVHDKYFVPWLSEETIQAKVKELASQMNYDYKDKRPLFICILNGSFMFAADLFKHIDLPAEISFIKLASYSGVKSTGHVLTSIGLAADIPGRDNIIVKNNKD